MAQTPLAAPHARQPYGVPKHPTDPLVLPPSPRHIRFCHPGYPDSHCSLFFLPALDRPSGVHHGLALDACAIVADNRWDGYFTLDREGVQRVPTDDMDLSLQADVYYFHVPGGSGDGPDLVWHASRLTLRRLPCRAYFRRVEISP